MRLEQKSIWTSLGLENVGACWPKPKMHGHRKMEHSMRKLVSAVILAVGAFANAQNTPAFVQDNTTGSSSASTTLSFSTNVTNGNALYAAVFDGNGVGDILTFTDSQGNSWSTVKAANLATDGDTIAVGCAIAGSSGADTVTFAINGSTAALVGSVYEVSNATCTPDVNPISLDTTAQTACNSWSLTTATVNDLLFGVCGISHNQPSLSAGTGWSDGSSAGSGALVYGLGELQIGSSPGSYTATSAAIPNGTTEQTTIEIAFKATTSGGGGGQAITGSGSANTVSLFTGTTTIGNSVISQSGNNVGIGTASPSFPLTVNGTASATSYCISGANCISAWPSGSGSSQWTTSGSSIYYNTGNVGIGTTSPAALLDVNGAVITRSQVPAISYLGDIDTAKWSSKLGGYELSFGRDNGGVGFDAWTVYGRTFGSTVRFTPNNGLETYGETHLATNGGDVGIGTTSPGATLEVNGSVKLSANSGGSITFQDGTVQSTAYTGVTCGGDYAESMDTTGDRKKYAPGDLLVLDPDHPGRALKSNTPYSTMVAGIYSTRPGTVGRRQATPKSMDEVPMALVGVVPTKVTAENGAIEVGDLLVSSSKPGYAMKGTDRSRMLGAVVGKAMGSLPSGTGVIEVLVSLQ